MRFAVRFVFFFSIGLVQHVHHNIFHSSKECCSQQGHFPQSLTLLSVKRIRILSIKGQT